MSIGRQGDLAGHDIEDRVAAEAGDGSAGEEAHAQAVIFAVVVYLHFETHGWIVTPQCGLDLNFECCDFGGSATAGKIMAAWDCHRIAQHQRGKQGAVVFERRAFETADRGENRIVHGGSVIPAVADVGAVLEDQRAGVDLAAAQVGEFQTAVRLCCYSYQPVGQRCRSLGDARTQIVAGRRRQLRPDGCRRIERFANGAKGDAAHRGQFQLERDAHLVDFKFLRKLDAFRLVAGPIELLAEPLIRDLRAIGSVDAEGGLHFEKECLAKHRPADGQLERDFENPVAGVWQRIEDAHCEHALTTDRR